MNVFRVQGDPDEFPLEMRRLTRAHDCNLVLFPWRDSAYAQKLFWSSVHVLGCPVALVVHKEVQPAEPLLGTSFAAPSSNNASGGGVHQRGRANSFFGSAFAHLFDTDDLDPGPAPNRPVRAPRPPRRRGGQQIVAVLTGRAMDVVMFSILLRFAESSTSRVTVFVPRDNDLFESAVLGAMASFQAETALAENVQMVPCEALSTDTEGLCRLLADSQFDVCVSAFVEPAQLDQAEFLAAMAHLSARDHPWGSVSSAISEAFRSSGPDALETRFQAGMPPRYAYCDLTHPELGELGSKLLQLKTPNACQVLVLHESHKMQFRRRASASSTAPPSADAAVGFVQRTGAVPSEKKPDYISTRVTINDIGLDDLDL